MDLKISKENFKKKTGSTRAFKVIMTLGIFILIVLGANFYTAWQLRGTVDIVKLKTSIPQDGRITEDNLVKGKMSRAEYEKQGVYVLSDGTKRRSIILWEDRKRIVGAFASYYLRKDTPLYWDSLTKQSPKKYAYLYKMDGELLRIDVDPNEFGTMLVPGDKINVRVSYTEDEYILPSERDFMLQQQLGIQNQTSVTKQEMLFNSATVLDILNSKGESIFDIYYRLLALPKAEQQKIVNTDDFKNSVKPSNILLNVTPEEADHYMSIQGKSPKFMMTLLPRTNGNVITEALNQLQIGLQRKDNQ